MKIVILPLIILVCGFMSKTQAQVQAHKQKIISAPQFVEHNISQQEGELLKIKLKNLPDPRVYGNTNGEVDLQINWVIGEDCHNGQMFSINEKVNETSHTFITDYKLSEKDKDKKIGISVSFIKKDSTPKYFISAQRNCISINL